jgi:hypothetical protein
MAGLDQHYGTDASLDAATVQQLGGWLQAHAGTYKRGGRGAAAGPHHPLGLVRAQAPRDRARGLEAASVKSAANCAPATPAPTRAISTTTT